MFLKKNLSIGSNLIAMETMLNGLRKFGEWRVLVSAQASSIGKKSRHPSVVSKLRERCVFFYKNSKSKF